MDRRDAVGGHIEDDDTDDLLADLDQHGRTAVDDDGMKGRVTTGNGALGIGRLEQATQESRDTERTGDRGLADRNPATAVGFADRVVGEQPDQWLGTILPATTASTSVRHNVLGITGRPKQPAIASKRPLEPSNRSASWVLSDITPWSAMCAGRVHPPSDRLRNRTTRGRPGRCA